MRDHNTFNVENRAQAALLECELKGQFSDGHWENSNGDWQSICDAKITCDPKKPLGADGFRPHTAYGCSSKELREVVGDRMILYAKAAIAFPEIPVEDIEILESYDWDLDSNDKKAISKVVGLENTPWSEVKSHIQNNLDAVVYEEKDLIKDLRKISAILKASVEGRTITREELNEKKVRVSPKQKKVQEIFSQLKYTLSQKADLEKKFIEVEIMRQNLENQLRNLGQFKLLGE